MKTINLKKIIMIMLATIITSVFGTMFGSIAYAETNNGSSVAEIVITLKENQEAFAFDKKNNTVIFSPYKAEKLGLNVKKAQISANYFNSLSDQQKATFLKSLNSNNQNTRIAPIIWWAAGVLGSWLGGKLLDWGSHSFCSHYRKYNSATRYVCNIID